MIESWRDFCRGCSSRYTGVEREVMQILIKALISVAVILAATQSSETRLDSCLRGNGFLS
jgi:hypothetical protein